MVGAVILAAGQSTRFGLANKLTAMWQGKPLVRHVFDAAAISRLTKVVVVTGHEASKVLSVLPAGCDAMHNNEYAAGMAGSIRAGIYRLQGLMPVMILLGDMPLVESSHINAMIEAYEKAKSESAIVVATCDGRLGNPVLFGPLHFAELKILDGDSGARALIEAHVDDVVKIEVGEAGRRDFDIPEAFDG